MSVWLPGDWISKEEKILSMEPPGDDLIVVLKKGSSSILTSKPWTFRYLDVNEVFKVFKSSSFPNLIVSPARSSLCFVYDIILHVCRTDIFKFYFFDIVSNPLGNKFRC